MRVLACFMKVLYTRVITELMVNRSLQDRYLVLAVTIYMACSNASEIHRHPLCVLAPVLSCNTVLLIGWSRRCESLLRYCVADNVVDRVEQTL